MTDIEISKALALAIGWEKPLLSERGIVVETGKLLDRVKSSGRWWRGYRVFDYRDPAVIWPIAKACEGFPTKGNDGLWSVSWFGPPADTPEKAVALAVIGGDEAK